jgi:hypothetical protein
LHLEVPVRCFRSFTDRLARNSIKRAISRALESLESRTLMSVSMDSNGYTNITPSADTKTIFVSNSQGSDGNSGLSENSPVKSIGKGMSLLRSGSPDWLMLKKGDTFGETLYWNMSGRSADEPMVISSYGTGSRPLIKESTNQGFYSWSGIHDLAITGIHFSATTRNPNSSDYNWNAAGSAGIQIDGPATNILLEDNQVDYFRDNIVVEAWQGNPTNIKVRKNVISNSWSNSSVSTNGKSQGMYISGTHGITVEDNVFDHNGWNEKIPGAGATIYGHNVYFWSDNNNVVFKNNISANAGSHGLQARSGGDIIGNLFLDDPIGMVLGKGNSAYSGGVEGKVTGNVFLGDRDISGQTRGWAIEVGNTRQATISDNIIANDTQNAFAAIRLSTVSGVDNPDQSPGLSNLNIENNTIKGWYQALDYSWDFVNGATGVSGLTNLNVHNNDFETTATSAPIVAHNSNYDPSQEKWSGNNYNNAQSQGSWYTMNGSNTSYDIWHTKVDTSGTVGPKQFNNAGRTVGAYNSSLGGDYSDSAFVSAASQMSKDHIAAAYTATAAVAYLREGFSSSGTSTSPSAPSTPPTTSTGSTGSTSTGTLDSVPPTTSVSPIPEAHLISSPDVTTAGLTQTIQVKYTDDQSILYGSLDSQDVVITGPNGYSAPAKFVRADAVANGSPRTVTYSISAPGGSWDATDNGNYTVKMAKYAVYDMSGNDVREGSIGSFGVSLTNVDNGSTGTTIGGGFLDSIPTASVSPIPQAQLVSAPTVNINGATETLTVTYTDNESILYGSLDSGDIWISGPNGFATNGKFVRADAVANGSPRTVTYTVAAPGGSWDRSDNGVYTVSMSKYAVYDMSGNDVAAKPIGSFTAAMV